MKTINDLVNKLNIFFGYGDFYIDKDDEMNSYTLYMKALGTVGGLIELSKEYKSWIALPSFGLAPAEIQKMIMDFIYNTDSNYWFDEPEKKYNIIIGKDSNYTDYLNVYRKGFYFEYHYDLDVEVTDKINVFRPDNKAQKENLEKEEYQFTESEIEDLKSTLPENMAKIVDLGKAEVKDENN